MEKAVRFIYVFCFVTISFGKQNNLGAFMINSPYDLVGKCTPAVLAFRNESFNIDDFANTGIYSYAFTIPGPVNVKCGFLDYEGYRDGTYKISTTILSNSGDLTTRTYDVNKIDDGVIDETLTVTDKNGSVTTYNFQIVVIKFDIKYGVLYYLRCSKYGTAATDLRSIVIKDRYYEYFPARRIAFLWDIEDGDSGFKGQTMQKLWNCPASIRYAPNSQKDTTQL